MNCNDYSNKYFREASYYVNKVSDYTDTTDRANCGMPGGSGLISKTDVDNALSTTDK